MMGEELGLLAPEITMHEEPGHITIDQGEVSVEIDDDEHHHFMQQQLQMHHQQRQQPKVGAFPFPNGGIPPEISITKVNHGNRGQMRPSLKVRSDLRPRQSHPPPLIRASSGASGLPPMPRLRFGGGPRVQRPAVPGTNPLAGMINMQRMMFPQGMPEAPPPQRPPPRMPPRQMVRPPPSRFPPQGVPHLQPPRMPSGNRMGGSRPPMSAMMFSQQHQQHRQPLPKKPTVINVHSPPIGPKSSQKRSLSDILPGLNKVSSKPGPASSKGQVNRGGPKVRTVFVPPPMKKMDKRPPSVLNNGSLNKQLSRLATLSSNGANNTQEYAEEEIDDAEEELDELDDVEPDEELDDVEPNNSINQELISKIDKHQVTVSITPRTQAKSNGSFKPKPLSKVLSSSGVSSASGPIVAPAVTASKVQYVRRADGKGFVRKIIGPKSKKKKKKPFRGANYRFDGSSIKKKGAPKTPKTDPQQQQQVLNAEEPPRDPAFLEYLGIQRKDSTDSKASDSSKGPTAKKSFQQQQQQQLDIASAQKRRLSLSDVLNSQKRIKRDHRGQLPVKNRFVLHKAKAEPEAEVEEEEVAVSSIKYSPLSSFCIGFWCFSLISVTGS